MKDKIIKLLVKILYKLGNFKKLDIVYNYNEYELRQIHLSK